MKDSQNTTTPLIKSLAREVTKDEMLAVSGAGTIVMAPGTKCVRGEQDHRRELSRQQARRTRHGHRERLMHAQEEGLRNLLLR
ncbi:MAG: hypothetical protein WA956_15430 [Stenotrophomonas sp.]